MDVDVVGLSAMPGGSKYRQWYAMRNAMRERGTWQGNKPTHAVPEQEEGEPAPKQSRWYEQTLSGADLGQPSDSPEPAAAAASPDEPPPLEASPTPEGESWH